ncbi:MAG: glycoside hydrolase family 38 C-terminal domain-containing protein [Terracidiphilus sp.]
MISALKARTCFLVLQLSFVGALLVVQPALGQHGVPVPQPGDNLPPASRAVIDRLASLAQLPAGTWKMHVGDMTHGEAANLDESGWQDVASGAKTTTDAVWFRQTVQIPDTLHGYDLTGARVWFQFRANANGPIPEILYFNGRRVAMGEDMEPIVLFDEARPGDKAVIAVKLLETVDVKQFRGATLRIDFPENRPNPEDLREEFLTAAELVPSLAPGDGGKMDTLNGAIGAVDVAALDTAEKASGAARSEAEAKFDASLKTAQGQLEALRPLLETATYYETGNSHIDAAWLWPWTETVDVVKRTFGTALQLMNEYPGYTFTQSAAAYNEWLADKYPEMNAEIKKRIEEGRWEVVGGMWVEPDLNLPDGESLVRQILVGKRWYKQAYGVDVRVGWNPDSFGYTWQLPQIYKKSGIDYFVTQKMTWNDTNQLPFKLFWWESPDGSKVLTYFPHDYVNTTLNPVRLAEDLAIARKRSPGMTDMMDLYGVGDHGGGPTRAMLDEGFHWKDPGAAVVAADGGAPVTPKYKFGTAINYFTAIQKEVAPNSPTWNYQSIAKGYEPPPAVPGEVSIPTWDTELYLEYHRGVYTTQAKHKHNMRTSEEEVLNAEKWSSLAWLDGEKYPDAELTEDWKKVLFNQFHDLAAGSGIADIYKDAQKDFDWVRMSTDEISSGALKTVAENIDTQTKEQDTVPVIVYNPLGWARSGDVTVKVQLPSAESGRVPMVMGQGGAESSILDSDEKTGVADLSIHVPDVPGMGYKVVEVGMRPAQMAAGRRAATREAGKLILQNEDLKVAVDEGTGCITSVVEKKTDYEALASGACGNQFEFFKDLPKQYDAWNIDPGTLDETPATVAKADSVEPATSADGAPAIRVTLTWQGSKFVQTISLKGDIVDIGNDIEWHEKHILLKAAFPLAVTSNFATYEIPYGTIERPTTRNNSWEKAQFEVPAQRWADLSGTGPDGKVHGLSLLNEDKFGYDAVGNVLRLTLLRSPTWPDPDADQGHQHFHYAIYPHAGTWKDALTERHGWEYNYPLQAEVATAHAGSLPAEHSFASVSPDNVVLTAVKKAEDAKGLIFRVYEWAGKTSTAEFHVPAGATSATVTNLMEEPEGSPLAVVNNVVKAPIHPYEILTIRVDYAGAGDKGTREQGN